LQHEEDRNLGWLILRLVAVSLSFSEFAAEPLVTARAVRDISDRLATEELPVRLEATIIHVDRTNTIFIQDDTGGTFLTLGKTRFAEGDPRWVPGVKVRAEGVTYPGLYVVGVRPSSIEIVGSSPLPAPTAATVADLASGRWHYQRVAIEGFVRSVATEDSGCSTLRLMTASGPIEIRVTGEIPRNLVEARVRVVGLAAGAINDRRQLVRPYVIANSPTDVTVLAPAPADAGTRPITPVRDLLRYAPQQRSNSRVRVSGVVTHHVAGETLFLRDGEDAIEVACFQKDHFQPGDVVEAWGFPRAGTFRAVLTDAELSRLETTLPPEPRDVSPDQAQKGAHEADLIRLAGEVTEAYLGPDGDVISLRIGDIPVRVRAPAGVARDLAPGAKVTVTGNARATVLTEGGYSLKPIGFEVLARSADDVRLTARPPWWTARRLLAALVGAGLFAVVALGWATALRIQVRRQTNLIREQSSREAMLEERQRIARDVHDTLEQELVALALQLDAARTIAAREGISPAAFDAARRLVGRLHEEVRALVWDLREGPHTDIVLAVRAIAARLPNTPPIVVNSVGDSWLLPAIAHHNIVRLLQEALTNAVKHAAANNVMISVQFTPDQLMIEVRDDGCGFDAVRLPPSGHYGLNGMHERARKMGAILKVLSALGQGTSVTVCVNRLTLEGDACQNQSV
jgi:signal transduction histidine kinase